MNMFMKENPAGLLGCAAWIAVLALGFALFVCGLVALAGRIP
jgi:hypothetical protein